MSRDRTDQLIDYLDGLLPEAERQELEQELAKSEPLQKELQEIKQLFAKVEDLPLQEPSKQLKATFYEQLEAHIKEKKSSDTHWLQLGARQWTIAAAVALVLIGLAFGSLWQVHQKSQEQITLLHSEMELTKKLLMLSILEQSSASERIQALNKVQAAVREQKYESSDQKIIDALINTMNFDDNINVRTKAAESLFNFSDAKGVVEAMIESLKVQESPEMQIVLIDILTEVKAKNATETFQTLVGEEGIHEVVRQKAAYGIEKLL